VLLSQLNRDSFFAFILAFSFFTFSNTSFTFAQDDTRVIEVKFKGNTFPIKLTDLKKSLKKKTGKVFDPGSKREIQYEGFLVSDVLTFARMNPSNKEEIRFYCQDGYKPIVTVENSKKFDLILMYQDHSAPKGKLWGKVYKPDGKTETDPGPFYVISSKTDHYKSFPWPYQVVALEVGTF